MLQSLIINNIVLIENLQIELKSGLNVLTGETGAGKSILLDAIGFVLGSRSGSGLLRQGADKGSVVACFNIINNKKLLNLLEDAGIEIGKDDDLIIRRLISKDGKSKAFVNDTQVAIQFVIKIADELLEIHGQNDQKGLLDERNHRSIIDELGNFDKELSELKSLFEEYKQRSTELYELQQKLHEGNARADYLKFAVAEIEKLNLKENEEEQLNKTRSVMLNKEKLVNLLTDCTELLDHKEVIGKIVKAELLLERNVEINPEFASMAKNLNSVIAELNDISDSLESYLKDIDSDSETDINLIEERLFNIKNIAKKHQIEVSQILAKCESLKAELEQLTNTEYYIEKKQQEVDFSKATYYNLATKISAVRNKIANALEKQLIKELEPLKMSQTRFKVIFEELPEANWNSYGFDKIHFVVSTNLGMGFGKLNKIASGGELSRFMLAMKVILSNVKSVPCMIFDEIDTGIGGAVADAVGERLTKIAKDRQVLVVTHQPQVASKANNHLRVIKQHVSNKTTTSVITLNDSQKIEEIARMLSGVNITDEARAQAIKLKETA